MFGALLEYSIILLHLKIYSVMQGIPENSTLMSLSRSVMPSGLLAGELPGTPMVTGSIKSQVKSSASHRDGSPTQNENGIRSSKEPRKRKFTSFNLKTLLPSDPSG